MTEPLARPLLPQSWAGQARCPWCGAREMRVLHTDDDPDRLACNACGLAFEIEQDGNRLHVLRWPSSLEAAGRAGGERWLDAAGLQALAAAEARLRASGAASDPQDVARRVARLREMGNGETQIRTLLARAGVPPGLVDAALAQAEQAQRQALEPQVARLRLAFGLGGVLLLVILMGVAYVIQRTLSGREAAAARVAAGTAPPTQAPGLLAVLGIDTPVVQPGAAPPAFSSGDPSACPRSAAEAAALFGGQAEAWSPGSNGWMMINSAQAASIYVPAGMTAAYLQVGNQLGLAEVHGPATMDNVSYVAISCP